MTEWTVSVLLVCIVIKFHHFAKARFSAKRHACNARNVTQSITRKVIAQNLTQCTQREQRKDRKTANASTCRNMLMYALCALRLAENRAYVERNQCVMLAPL